MSIKTKIAILLLAAVLSFLEFNWIVCSSPFYEILKVSRAGSYAILAGASLGQPDAVVTASLRP